MNDDDLMPSQAASAWDDETRYGGRAKTPEGPAKPRNALDSAANKARLKQLREWFDQEWNRQAANRYQQAMDEDYYDSLQWAEEDAQVLLERGQAPVVYNEIKPSIDWMIGTERRTRVDYKVLARRKDEGDMAEVKTKLLKYLSDVNGSPQHRSRAFASACKGGVGWLEIGIRGDESDEPLYYRAESWRYMLYDSQAMEPDLSDARYLFRWKWLDADVAETLFPNRKLMIQQAAINAANRTEEDEDESWYLGARVTEPGADYARTGKYRPYEGGSFTPSTRNRVKLIEAWYRVPERRQLLRGGQLAGDAYEETNPEHQRAIEEGASVYDGLVMTVRCAIYCSGGLLYEGKSPYRHGRFPFVPVWAYRRARDNAPYSPIRVMRDSQDSLNKRGSKALWILSTNQIVMEAGAVEDVEELRDEAARPDAIIVKNRGKELVINRDGALAEQHLRLMDRDALSIRQAGGVTNENLGRQTNASSGKAIIARQDQGGVVTTELFDNLRWAVQWAGEIELSLVEQFFTESKTVRLVGERGNSSFVPINEVDPETGETLNDVTATKADFVVSQQDYRDSLRMAMFESLFEIVGRLAQMSPQVALNMLDLVVEMADVPGRDELVARIRQLNGQRDPEREPTPEEQQAQAAQQALQQAQQEIGMATMKAELEKLLSEREKLGAEAINKRLEAMYAALQSAQIVAAAPAAAVVADEIMKGAGFTDQSAQADAAMIRDAAQQMRQPGGLGEGQMAAMTGPGPGAPSPYAGMRQGAETMADDGMRGL